MLVSPFTFYRGAALIMASDLAGTPRSGLTTQVCGDAHLMNFGVFGSPERRLVFGINDFDETFPGPWEWDVKRLAASFAIAGRDNGYTAKDRKKVLLTLLGAYRSAMREFAGMTNLAVWYSHLDVDTLAPQLSTGVDKATAKRAEANVAKARTRDSMQAFDKLTHVVDGERRIISDPPLIQPIEELVEGMDRERDHGDAARHHPRLPAHLAERPPAPARGVPPRPRGPQGRRRRQRRHPGVDPADVRPRRARPAVPPGQGGPGVGARGVRRRAAVPGPTARGSCTASTSCRRPATSSSAGRPSKASTASAATSTSASCATGRAPRWSRP